MSHRPLVLYRTKDGQFGQTRTPKQSGRVSRYERRKDIFRILGFCEPTHIAFRHDRQWWIFKRDKHYPLLRVPNATAAEMWLRHRSD